MRSRSALQTLIEETLNELEYELESESGVEFQSPPPANLHKWEIYTSIELTGDDDWRCHSVSCPPRRMTAREADDFGDSLLKDIAGRAGPFDERVGIIRYVFTENGPIAEKGRQIIILTKEISPNSRFRDRMTDKKMKDRKCPDKCR